MAQNLGHYERWTKTNLKCLKCDVLGPLLELNCVTESGMLTSDENFISTRPLPKKSTNGNWLGLDMLQGCLTPDTHTKHTNMISQRQDHVDAPRWDGKIRSGASQNYPSTRQNIKPRIGLIGEGLAIGKQGDTQSCAHKSSQVVKSKGLEIIYLAILPSPSWH